mgnify:FL=1
MSGVQRGLAVKDGMLITGISQDCTPIVEYTKARHREGHHGSNEMRLAASIPFVLIEKYLGDQGITFQEFAVSPDHKRRLLSDPALADFRVWRGAL